MQKRRCASGRTLLLVSTAVIGALAGMLSGTPAQLGSQAAASGLTTCTWTGAAPESGVVYWSTPGNWDCGSGTSNGPPATGDLVVFPATVPSSGSTANLDESTSELAGITFENSYTLNITSSATTLNLDPSYYGAPGNVAISETARYDMSTVGPGNGSEGSIVITGYATIEAAAYSALRLDATLGGRGGSTLTFGASSTDGTGTVALGGPTTYSDLATFLAGGTLTLDASSPSLPSTTSLTLMSDTTLILAGPGGSSTSPNEFTFGNDIYAAGGSVIGVEPNMYNAYWTFTGTLDLTGSGFVDIDTGGMGANDDLYISGQVTGAAGIDTIGDWTTYLTNSSNDYSGGTYVGGPGTLAVSASGALGSGYVTDLGNAPIVLSDGATPTNQLYANGASTYCGGILCGGHVSQSSSYTSTGGWAGPITLEGTTYLGAEYAGDELEISGPISGAYGIVTGGGGTVLLSGDNTYTGPTEAASGVLEVASGNALGGSSGGQVTVESSATLQLASGSANAGCLPAGMSPAPFTLPNEIVLTGSATGGEELDNCEGTNTISGKVALASNTVVVDVNCPSSIPCPTSSDLTLSGPVVGSGGLTLGSGAGGIYGQLTLSGDDTYTGATTVEEGILDVTGSIASSSGLTLYGGNVLEGTGAVPAVTTSSCSTSACTVYPGDAPGVLSSSGYANLSASGTTLQVSLPSSAPGAYSELVAAGADIAGTNLSITSAASAPYGTTYVILDDTSSSPVTGTFSYDGSPLSDGETFQAGGEKFIINYDGGPSGLDVTLTDVTNPPPPPPVPVVSSVSPSNGPASGGTTVTISGENLSGTAYVHFGNVEASSFTVLSSTEISATSPPGTSGQSVDVTVTTPGGTSAASTADVFTYTPGTKPLSLTGYHPLSPVRICDTRPSNPSGLSGAALANCEGKAPGPAQVLTIQASGLGGIPSDATAIAMNVTVVDPTAGGYLSVYPAGEANPGTSNVNFTPGSVTANLVFVGLPSSGQVSIFNSAGVTNLVVDVEGYVGPETTTGTGLYVPLQPSRICDTRPSEPANPCTGRAPAAGGNLEVPVLGQGGVPSSDVAAVAVTLTAIDPIDGGFLGVYPAGTAYPGTSNVNFTAGEVVANTVIVPVGANGSIEVYSSSGDPEVAIDVEGYVTGAQDPSATGSVMVPASSPVRICDTRPSNPSGLSGAALANCEGKTMSAGSTLTIQVTGLGGVPADASAAILNVTVTDATANSYLSAWPAGSTRPVASVLNWQAGETRADLAVVGVGSGGEVSFYENAGSADLIVDVFGWLVPATGSGATTSS